MRRETILEQREFLAKQHHLWQFDLLDCDQFSKFCSDRGLGLVRADLIRDLWKLGLLRAEVVRAPKQLERLPLRLLSSDAERSTYLDDRSVVQREEGYRLGLEP